MITFFHIESFATWVGKEITCALRALVFALVLVVSVPPSLNSAFAGPLAISTASTTALTVNATTNNPLSITTTGSLTLGSTTVPITVTGNSAITNSGQILQTGTGRGILVNAGTLSLGITNNVNALIQTADADTLR